ncbi:MAG: Gfo/Idh/MocA family oxidoreductase [Thermoguttaceae bacterium]|jgi:predicted dehydrogenase|nr:Gfo/Idh/MocA family oxidoreductase [Thermoguttaceae bacterium]
MSFRHSISRRRFLGHAATTLAVPAIIPRTVLASATQLGANDRIGVGYIGVGRRAGGLYGLPKEGQVVAAADVHEARAQAIAEKFKAKPFTHYRKLLDMKEVDAVVNAAPDHWRAIQCIHACQARKHIYAEKSLTLTIREGRAICDAVKKYNIVFQTGSQQRSMAANRRACELIRNGVLGKIEKVIGANYPTSWLMNLPGEPVPEGLDWDQWCGPAPLVPYHIDLYSPRRNPGWLSVWPYSGGEMTGWGAHGLDQIQWALGADDGGPLEVWCEDGKYEMPVFDKPISRGEGDAMFRNKWKVHYLYPGGVEVVLDNGSGAGGIFIGEKGRIEIRRNAFSANPSELADAELPESAVRLVESNNHMGNWFDCMKTGALPVANAEVGHRSTTVCHLGNIARWVGRRLKWDPVKEEFPGDDEANRYLDVDRRKGYELPVPV